MWPLAMNGKRGEQAGDQGDRQREADGRPEDRLAADEQEDD